MDFAHARLICRLAVIGLAAFGFFALGSATQAAPPQVVSPLAAEDSPAPDDGGDSSSDPEPTEEPEPSDEPTSEPTTAPTQAAKSGNSSGSNHADGGGSSSSNSDDDSNGGADVAPNSVPTDSASEGAKDEDKTSTDDASNNDKNSTDWATVGWVLLAGGLASAAGAFVIYRRNPDLISLPRLNHAQ